MKKHTNHGRNQGLFEAIQEFLHGIILDRGYRARLCMDLDWNDPCEITLNDNDRRKIVAVSKDADGRKVIVAEYELKEPPKKNHTEIPTALLRQLIMLAELGIWHRDFPPPEFKFPKATPWDKAGHRGYGDQIIHKAKLVAGMKVE